MPKTVSNRGFAPKGKNAGTCFAEICTEVQISLKSNKWGMKAEFDKNQNFLIPVRITNVSDGSEADVQGLRNGDVITSVQSGDGKFVEVQAQAGASPTQQVVQEEVSAVLLRGGSCTLKVQRWGLACTECGKYDVEKQDDSYDHSLVCTNCGLVARSSMMSTESEWRIFEGDEVKDKSRVGMAQTLQQQATTDVGTKLQAPPGTRKDNGLVHAARRTEDGAARRKEEQERKLAASIDVVCSNMGITGGCDATAKELLSRFLRARSCAGLTRLRLSPAAVGAACVFLACKAKGVHRTLKEMSSERATACSPKQLRAAITTISKLLPPLSSSSSSAAELLPRFCGHLSLQMPAERRAARVLASAPPALLDRHLPTSLAAAAIARACRAASTVDAAPTVEHVSKATGAAASTILSVLRHWDRLDAASGLDAPPAPPQAPPPQHQPPPPQQPLHPPQHHQALAHHDQAHLSALHANAPPPPWEHSTELGGQDRCLLENGDMATSMRDEGPPRLEGSEDVWWMEDAGSDAVGAESSLMALEGLSWGSW